MKGLGRHSETPFQRSVHGISFLPEVGYGKHGFHNNLKTIYDGKMTKSEEPHSLLHI